MPVNAPGLLDVQSCGEPSHSFKKTRLSQPVRAALLSLVLLIPCFWQSRIQSVDLRSHIYNAWLTQQIESGKAPGLTLAPITTNVLFDLMLYPLFRSFGSDVAQRIAVSIVVLIFFWGAFAMVSAASRVRPWFLVPCLLMLTYGWVFHMGFLNYYLAAALSFWALALSYRTGIVSWIGVVALLALAYTGNALPPVWAAGAIAFRLLSRRFGPLGQSVIFSLAACCIVGLRFWIFARYPAQSLPLQPITATSAVQVWVFGVHYAPIAALLLFLWGFLLLRLSHQKGFAATARDSIFQLCVLTWLCIALIPSSIQFPQFAMPLTYIDDRTTLLEAVLICALLGAANPPKWLRAAFVPLALVYFTFLYIDTSLMNKMEDRIELLVSGRPTLDKVITSLDDPANRIHPWGHMMERVCVGKCISYGNYEPFSKAFRVQTLGPNPLVVANAPDFRALEDGGYVVKPDDVPFYQVTLCGDRKELCLQSLAPGAITRHDLLSLEPQ